MGLDMYLEGRKYFWTDWKNPENNPKEDGFEIREKILKLGYWRKHPNLHGYIVQNFAAGVDNCQDIELCEDDLIKILHAVEADNLPHTEGFFFGTSQAEDKEPTIQQLKSALEWIRTPRDKNREMRTVVYRASW